MKRMYLFFTSLFLFLSVQGEIKKPIKPLHLFFETGYTASTYFSNRQWSGVYKNNEPKNSYLRLGLSFKPFSIALARESFHNINKEYLRTQAEKNVDIGSYLARYHTIYNLSFSYQVAVNKTLSLEPNLAFSYRSWVSESFLKYHDECVAWCCFKDNIAYYDSRQNIGLGLGMQVKQMLLKNFYVALGTQYQTFKAENIMTYVHSEEEWRNLQVNRTVVSYYFKLGCSFNIRGIRLKKSVQSVGRMSPLQISRP